MATDDYNAGLLGETVGHDTFSYSYQMGTQERERRARGESSGGGGSGGGGGGIVFVAFAVIIAFCAFIVGFCTYPLAGFATLVAFFIGSDAFGGGPKMNFVGLVFALMVPCYIVFILLYNLELKLAKRRGYQVFRHYWRIVVGTYVIHAFASAFHRGKPAPGESHLSGYLMDGFLTVLGFFLVYLNSRRLDAKYELKPIRIGWIERLLDPVRAWVAPPFPKGIREIGGMHAKTMEGRNVKISIGSDGILALGETRIPVANVRVLGPVRKYRGRVVVAGIALFFLSPVFVKGMFGNFIDFMPQAAGLLGILVAVFLVFCAFFERTPPGLFAGPFRYVEVAWSDGTPYGGNAQIQFRNAADERLFTGVIASASLPEGAIAS